MFWYFIFLNRDNLCCLIKSKQAKRKKYMIKIEYISIRIIPIVNKPVIYVLIGVPCIQNLFGYIYLSS